MRTIQKSLIGAVSAALALVMATGCTSGQTTGGTSTAGSAWPVKGKITLVYLQKQGDQQYFVDQANGAKKQAAAMGDVEITVLNLGTDSNKAISEVDSAIARKANGIIIVAPDQAVGPQVMSAAAAAGIPLMASDDPLKDSSGAAAPFVGFNGTAMGNKVGEEAAKAYLKEGWMPADTAIISAYKQDLSVCTQRVQGALDSFKKGINGAESPKVIEIGTDNSPTNAMDKTSPVVTGNPAVKHWIVWGCNDQNTTGAVTALQNAGFGAKDIIGVGLGADMACKDWKAGQDTGNRAALFISGTEVGKSAVEAMVNSLRSGTSLPAETIADTTMVNKDNYVSAGVQCQ